MDYISTGMDDHSSALLLSLMALQLTLIDRNPFRPCYICIHRIASGGYYGFDFVTPPPQCVERFHYYPSN